MFSKDSIIYECPVEGLQVKDSSELILSSQRVWSAKASFSLF